MVILFLFLCYNNQNNNNNNYYYYYYYYDDDDLFGVAENIKSLFVNSMGKWKLMLCSENSELGEVETK